MQVFPRKPDVVLSNFAIVVLVGTNEVVEAVLTQDAVERALEIVGVGDHKTAGLRGQNTQRTEHTSPSISDSDSFHNVGSAAGIHNRRDKCALWLRD